MATAYLLLGTNIGCRIDHLKDAAALIAEMAGDILTASSVYETAAWGKLEQADYLNQVLAIQTSLTPEKLLQTTAEIETRLGRVRKALWEPRTIDIDILFYENEVRPDKILTLPHPHIPKRRFVLTPLAEIAPDYIHPVLNKSISELLRQCTDPLWVEKYETAPVS